jgi:hypothetical protein
MGVDAGGVVPERQQFCEPRHTKAPPDQRTMSFMDEKVSKLSIVALIAAAGGALRSTAAKKAEAH